MKSFKIKFKSDKFYFYKFPNKGKLEYFLHMRSFLAETIDSNNNILLFANLVAFVRSN